ncbi:MAG: YggS family pyridoxal phosphate-dependent enzyme [Bifidobacteriaceae bacterium]|jgi:pyridoxal phosphate enzyme (YggS family)|nr:YggS family pyridoxal phosphate-dependent enzyme [Bifidobacteriaceae bacterium]
MEHAEGETAEAVERRLRRAWERIEAACAAAGRPPGAARLLLAVKTQPVEAIRAAIGAGARLIGENRVQELVSKGPELADLPHKAHMIGQLQSNKVNAVLRWADCVETVDSLRLAERLSARAAGREVPLDVMIQVNTSAEPSKGGVAPPEAVQLAEAVAPLDGLRLTGLMTVGPNVADPAVVRRAYASLRRIGEELAARGLVTGPAELSMGMSGDLELAVAEGATIVRLGTAVFGPRATPA